MPLVDQMAVPILALSADDLWNEVGNRVLESGCDEGGVYWFVYLR